MELAIFDRTGVYIAYPTSPAFKSIYRAKNYKTQVNDQHTKVGKAQDSFKSRKNCYLRNFDNETEFLPIALIDWGLLKLAEKLILGAVGTHFSKVGRAHEWFQTTDRKKILEIIARTLTESDIEHELIA